jgi:LytS/YehU family sensor histidine kinase
MVGMLAVALVFALAMHQWFSAKARQIIAEREAAEAQLRLLQGQIEPHFLFNTLANVSSLMETDAPRARQMLGAFTDYLRGSLDGLREDGRTLGEELTLVQAYLDVQGIRLEDRLRVEWDVPADLRTERLPTLAVQPLVENAVLHGIEPSLSGGTVRVAARRDGATLVVTGEDDGVGPGAAAAASGRRPAGNGRALANLRARLAALHGAAAQLQLSPREPHGTRVTIRLPSSRASAPAEA